MDKKTQIKIALLSILILIILSLLIYAVATELLSPAQNAIDDDGFLDLKGRCVPSNMNGTTSWNVTNATLYAKIGSGSWLANKTLQVPSPRANLTYLFNFTNDINSTADETDVIWNIQCNEQMEDGTTINTAFTVNQTVKVRYAIPDVTISSPDNNHLDIDGNDINFTGFTTATADLKWNITRVDLYTNVSGSWKINASYDGFPVIISQAIYFNLSGIGVTGASLPDGSKIVWGVAVTQVRNITSITSPKPSNEINITFLNKTFFTTNRTLLVEYPPSVRLALPTSGSWEKGANSVLNFTTNSTFITSLLYQCSLYTNETGTWNVKLSSISATNGTYIGVTYQFPDGLSDIRWGIFCNENVDPRVGNFSVNNTVRVDRTNPVPTISLINLSSPVNDSFYNANNLIINYSLSDPYPNTCDLYVNNTINGSNSASLATGNIRFNASAGVYVLKLGCNDTAGNYVNQSTDYWIAIDLTYPTYNRIGNVTVSGSAHQRLFGINISEPANLTVYYGTTIDTTSSAGNITFQRLQNLTISNFAQNTLYYYNLTICDRANNCNLTGGSFGLLNFTYPYKLLTGWSYYAMYDARINFSVILNQTEAEFVYYWNSTAQKWVSAQAGATSNMDFLVGTSTGERSIGGRHVIALFESSNSTWGLRNTTSVPFYQQNLTTGDNFIKLGSEYTFGNLSLSFLNNSHNWDDRTTTVGGYGFNVEISQTPSNFSKNAVDSPVGGLFYNLTDLFFSAYNNTAATWQPYYVYNSTLENGTILTPRIAGDYTNMEVVWVFSRLNLTWNGTNVIGNWSY